MPATVVDLTNVAEQLVVRVEELLRSEVGDQQSVLVHHFPLRLRHACLSAANRMLCKQIEGRLQLTDRERQELTEIGAKLGKKALAEIATMLNPIHPGLESQICQSTG